jgi:hypothetical protein
VLQRIKNESFDILHVSCHTQVDHNQVVFNLDDINLSIKDIQLLPDLESKIIFFNSCRTGNVDPTKVVSITNDLLQKKSGAVISVDVDVPDSHASDLTVFFYKGLLNGEKIDKLLFDFSSRLLKTKKDISGFFYSVYGADLVN